MCAEYISSKYFFGMYNNMKSFQTQQDASINICKNEFTSKQYEQDKIVWTQQKNAICTVNETLVIETIKYNLWVQVETWDYSDCVSLLQWLIFCCAWRTLRRQRMNQKGTNVNAKCLFSGKGSQDSVHISFHQTIKCLILERSIAVAVGVGWLVRCRTPLILLELIGSEEQFAMTFVLAAIMWTK